MADGWIAWHEVAGHQITKYHRSPHRNGGLGRERQPLRGGWDDVPDHYILQLARDATSAGDGVLYTMAPAGHATGLVICHGDARSRLYTRDSDELAEFMEKWMDYYRALRG